MTETMSAARTFSAFPRWQLDATLTTLSPLHVGSGGDTERSGLYVSNDDGAATRVRISAVSKDHRGLAYIPGASLRGALRAWVAKQDAVLAAAMFGGEKAAGFVEVRNAYFKSAAVKGLSAGDPVDGRHPYWCDQCATAVVASVAIDRKTRTVAPEKLFHGEYVPPGVSFDVSIVAHGLEGSEIRILRDALFALEHGGLGAETGNGWGRLRVDDCTALTRTAPASQPTSIDVNTLVSPIGVGGGEIATSPQETYEVVITVEGGFLVNEPSRSKAKGQGAQPNDTRHNHMPRLDSKGRPYLPARSFRGALRSQAERILRTLFGDPGACSTRKPCAAIKMPDDMKSRPRFGKDQFCIACRVFGGGGWRSRVSFSDFVPFVSSQGEPKTAIQEFVAIDRFTGGAAGSRKFSAERAVNPVLVGSITLAPTLTAEGRALLALVLRDLEEGDIAFGWGRAKGYGSATATVRPALNEPDLDSLLMLRGKSSNA